MYDILTNVRLLHEASIEKWTWGTMYISRDDYEPHCEFHNDPVTDDCWLQNRYKWEYQNFGVLAREDEFEPHVYKEPNLPSLYSGDLYQIPGEPFHGLCSAV